MISCKWGGWGGGSCNKMEASLVLDCYNLSPVDSKRNARLFSMVPKVLKCAYLKNSSGKLFKRLAVVNTLKCTHQNKVLCSLWSFHVSKFK